MAEPALGLVLPAYKPNVDRLETYVYDLLSALDAVEIRIEIDAPRSGVVGRLEALPATVHAVPERRGKGAAITAGFEALETDVLAFADADGATPAPSIADVVAPVQSNECDLAVGSRRHPEGNPTTTKPGRRYVGDAFSWLARRFLTVDLYDYQCGAKAMTADAWQQVRGHLHEPGFAWDVELLAIAGARGLHVVEVPVEWHDVAASTISPIRTPAQLCRSLVVARHRAKRLQGSRLHAALANGLPDQRALVEQR